MKIRIRTRDIPQPIIIENQQEVDALNKKIKCQKMVIGGMGAGLVVTAVSSISLKIKLRKIMKEMDKKDNIIKEHTKNQKELIKRIEAIENAIN